MNDATVNGFDMAFRISTTPEPGSLALFPAGCGFAFLMTLHP